MRKANIPAPGHLFGPYPESRSAPATPSVLVAAMAQAGGSRLIAHWQRRRLLRQVARVRKHQENMPGFPGAELHHAMNAARAEMSRDGFASEATLRCMAGVLTCIRAVSGHVLRDNQIMAALTVLRGELAEMPTGEGKTLSTALAAATAALAGVPVHVITSNDYLAARDADQLRPLYRLLGLSVSAIRQDFKRDDRIEAYACNLTYCSAKELVFDYLRDRMSPMPKLPDDDPGISAPTRVLRGLCMAIIDEADSVLIDEALTPFILSESYKEASQVSLCTLALQIADRLQAGTDYHPQGGSMELSADGRAVIAEQVDSNEHALWAIPRYREELVQLALTALCIFKRDEHYIVRDGKVHIVDANTGRVAEGRAWSRGLQQMVEIKEGCLPSPATRVMAQITFQRFFPRYYRIGGMSGTLAEARRELLEVYGLPVVKIPSHKASQLQISPPRVFASARQRWSYVLRVVVARHASGQPVLIGTDSVRDSEFLSQLLAAQDLPHRVLNARQDREEAELVSHAGRRSAITVATNMAGRGTDIHIAPEIADIGGLHVISCQHNSAKRIDRQLYGRAARQGQPGSAEAVLSLEEGLLGRSLSPAVCHILCLSLRSDGTLPLPVARALFRLAQWFEENRSRKARKQLRAQDAAMQQSMHFGLPSE
ncbi:MAG TPA: preprotein translocase subunit SecA [Rhodocyclaceae bacterium]|nr:preprotein translocase subunit SecA [Rhodocyclaceae bacterium]